MSDLVERLNSLAQGYDEWRVQDPKDGSYCIAFSWPEVTNPEREAREWLADTQRRYPDYPHAGYVVAKVRVMPQKEAALSEAAAEIERLRAEVEGLRKLVAEMLELADNWPGIAYTEELERRARAAIDSAMGGPNPELTGASGVR